MLPQIPLMDMAAVFFGSREMWNHYGEEAYGISDYYRRLL